ncbi:hypothetical protein NQ011_07970 [Corynebacterium phoceense]|uniref:hypothetical protein n=1 Tax=Corynebacterium phoceense TaxID=1686286 RepID=UPI00211C51D3|nr:hypothetical protein [Corynebacterium phoceense]MCQ9336617.1 hypothetical protein [Corynebacterium phoceense]
MSAPTPGSMPGHRPVLKPHDPQAVVSPESVDERVDEILSEPAANLREEFEQLDRAHTVLRDVLQEN